MDANANLVTPELIVKPSLLALQVQMVSHARIRELLQVRVVAAAVNVFRINMVLQCIMEITAKI